VNIQHSSRTDRWFTPPHVLDLARQVLGPIDLDPTSEPAANELVGAKRFITAESDALVTPWDCANESVWLNPPGGKRGNKSLVVLFWERLLSYRGEFSHAIFMAFSAEALQTTQRCALSAGSFPVCIPRKRLRFVSASGVPGLAPSHSNAIVYVPGRVNRSAEFAAVFSSLGNVVGPMEVTNEKEQVV
jgi:hypothetical protein